MRFLHKQLLISHEHVQGYSQVYNDFYSNSTVLFKQFLICLIVLNFLHKLYLNNDIISCFSNITGTDELNLLSNDFIDYVVTS